MIRSQEQARAVQARRESKGLTGLSGAVKRWNKRNPAERVVSSKLRAGRGGPSVTPRGWTPRFMSQFMTYGDHDTYLFAHAEVRKAGGHSQRKVAA